jgi:hypothetical protein
VRPSEPASGTYSRDVGVPDPPVRWLAPCSGVGGSYRKPVQIIVMSVTVVTLPVFIELLRDAAYTLSRDRHVIVTEETPYLSGFLATVTAMTLLYGLILDRGRTSTS